MKERPISGLDRSKMVTQGQINALNDGPLSSQPIPPHDPHYHDQAQFESDKRAVYKYANIHYLCNLTEFKIRLVKIG